jgi:hypothetical protein
MDDPTGFDDLDRNVSVRRSRPTGGESATSEVTPDVYEARQMSGSPSGSAQSLVTSLPALAIGALIGFLAGFWIFRERD